MTDLKFFIGYDSSQPEAAGVCKRSLLQWTSESCVEFLKLSDLSHCYHRPLDPRQATEFSFSRFLVPYLMDYQGWAVFCDSDFLWVGDALKLQDHADPRVCVSVVQHDISPQQLTSVKMNNKPQMWYPRKNWSSLMLINCGHELSRQLTPELVNTAPASYLHQLEWAEHSIGSLPVEFNFLVGYYPAQDNVCAYHFTDGTPIMPGYELCEYSDLWMNMFHQI